MRRFLLPFSTLVAALSTTAEASTDSKSVMKQAPLEPTAVGAAVTAIPANKGEEERQVKFNVGEDAFGFVLRKSTDGNLFAYHTSHSSHASHRSHYSSR